MVNSHVVKKQLHAIGADQTFWGKGERAELPKIMIPGEIIEHVQHGRYENGFATLVATNHRLLVVDKKLFFLNVVDLSYEKIAEEDFGQNTIAATIHVRSAGSAFKFQSFNHRKLREMANYIQFKIVEMSDKDPRQNTRQANDQPVVQQARRQPIPMQVFKGANDLTDEQANGLLPLSHAAWRKVDPRRHLANPYSQSSLLNRRRIGRFDFVNDNSSNF